MRMIRYNPKTDEGLSLKQVDYRKKQGQVNYVDEVKTKSIGQIIFYNVFTLLNLINLVLGILVISVHEYKNALFLGVIISNTIIGIAQEIKSKKVVDKLKVVMKNTVTVIRNSKEKEIDIKEIVLDDIIKLKKGDQIICDSIILDGNIVVNESFITGESDPIEKNIGDRVYSGSFITSGNAILKVEKVGKDNYTSIITKDAKYIKKVNSLLLKTLNKIIKTILYMIIPLGIILFIKEFILLDEFNTSIVNTVAALVTMIPDGLFLLTSTVLAVGTIRLSKKNVLVQQLYILETLARVDTLCLDKTGTLTEGIMEVEDVIVLDKKYDYKNILANISLVLKDDSATIEAIHKKYKIKDKLEVKSFENFSSDKKYSSVTFKEGKYIIGAPDILDNSKKIKDLMKENSNYRQVLLKTEKNNIALILLKDKIRDSAKKTLEYFKKYGVDIKIISGDSKETIENIAERLNLKNKKSIDMSQNITNMNHLIVEENDIFARVSPTQKKDLICALKKNGHTVAMIGDGVNDCLALKESDCALSFKSADNAARNVSELILLDDNFDSVPDIVEEGRKIINNLERSSTLFLSKTTYAILLIILFLILPVAYPLQPIQTTLIGVITIGIPSFILALEPNNELVEGNFLRKILKKAIPSGITVTLNIIVLLILKEIFKIDSTTLSSIAIILVTQVGFILLYKISTPFNKLRLGLFIFLLLLFVGLYIFLGNFLEITMLNINWLIIILIIFILDILLFNTLCKLFKR